MRCLLHVRVRVDWLMAGNFDIQIKWSNIDDNIFCDICILKVFLYIYKQLVSS